jgi:uncharacterized protein YqcC (DUF446 family)
LKEVLKEEFPFPKKNPIANYSKEIVENRKSAFQDYLNMISQVHNLSELKFKKSITV